MPDRDYEDVTAYSLDQSAEAELLSEQAEAVHTTAAELANEPSDSVH